MHHDYITMTQYEMRFSELSHHAIWFVPIDRVRIRRFVDGLTYQLQIHRTRERVSGASFEEVVVIARDIESIHCRSEWRGRPRGLVDPVVLVVLLMGFSFSTVEVVHSDMLCLLNQFTVVHHRAMVLTILIRAIHHLEPSQPRVRHVLHQFTTLPFQDLLPVTPVRGVPSSSRYQH